MRRFKSLRRKQKREHRQPYPIQHNKLKPKKLKLSRICHVLQWSTDCPPVRDGERGWSVIEDGRRSVDGKQKDTGQKMLTHTLQ